jgi:hypothetical protein
MANRHSYDCRIRMTLLVSCLVLTGLATGCGTTKTTTATQHLLMSNALDTSIASMDFGTLAGKKVYLDTQYVQEVKGFGFVNSHYIISSLRQQLVSSGCRLQDSAADAEVIVEARVGTLGVDNHDVVYGIPSTSVLSSAAALMTSSPALPAIPEISFAKRVDSSGIAKLAVFAYRREDRQGLWQSGTQLARSTSSDFWILGAGPFQWGTIHDGTRFAGKPIDLPLIGSDQAQLTSVQAAAMESYQQPANYLKPESTVIPAAFEHKLDLQPLSPIEPPAAAEP